jgi:hypothetical protein
VEPGQNYAGLWASVYEYHSTSRDAKFTGVHQVRIEQDGDRLTVRSVPSAPSSLTMSLVIDGRVITGTWSEITDPGGHYAGARFHGALQFLADPDGRRLAGRWVGFGKHETINTGRWDLGLID